MMYTTAKKQRITLLVDESEVMLGFVITKAQKLLWLKHIKKISPRGEPMKLEDWIMLTLDSEAGGLD